MHRCENGAGIGGGVFVFTRRESIGGGRDRSHASQDMAVKKGVEYPFLSLPFLAISSDTQLLLRKG